jgi:hypothetical protein
MPSIPTEKPTARPTVDGSGNIATNNAPSHSGGLKTGGAVAIGVVASLIVLSLLGMAVWFVQKKKKGKGPRDDSAAPSPFTSSHNSGIKLCTGNYLQCMLLLVIHVFYSP